MGTAGNQPPETPPKPCPQCGAPRAAGYPLDCAGMLAGVSPNSSQAVWVMGRWEQNWLTGTKFGNRQIWRLAGLRCESCGLIELFAREKL